MGRDGWEELFWGVLRGWLVDEGEGEGYGIFFLEKELEGGEGEWILGLDFWNLIFFFFFGNVDLAVG